MALLEINNLSVEFPSQNGVMHAVDGISLSLEEGEVLGIVGESGSGKTTLLEAISARLAPQQGEVLYHSRALYALSEADRPEFMRMLYTLVNANNDVSRAPADGLKTAA